MKETIIHQRENNIFLVLRSIIRRRFIVLLTVAVIGGIAGILFAWLNKPRYEAVTTFALEDEGGNNNRGLFGIASQLGLDLSVGGAGIFNRDNITELLLSRRIVERSLLSTITTGGKEQSLVQYLLEQPTGINKPKRAVFQPGITPETFSPTHDSLMSDVYKYVVIKLIEVREPDKRRNIFTIIVSSPDPVWSKLFSDRLMSETFGFYVESRTKRAKLNVDILQKRVDSIRSVINYNAYNKAAISDANINPLFQQSQVNAQLRQSDLAVAGAAYSELVKNLEVAKYTLLRQTPLVQVIDTPRFPLEKKGYSRLISGLAGAFIFGFLCLLILIALALVKNFSRQINTVTVAAD